MDKPDSLDDSIMALLLPREFAALLANQGVVARVALSDRAGQPLPAAAQTRLFAELRAAQQKLEHLRRLAQVATLAAGVTHEARNLLTGSLGFAQLLRAKAHEAASVQEMASTIETELRRCVDIVASFLKLSRSGMEPTRELAIAEVLGAVERLVQQPVRQRGCTLRVTIGDGLPQVLGRAGDLQRVLINLILNAADAAHRPGVHIAVSAQRSDDGALAITVADDGPGVPPAIGERIFEAFFSTKQAGEGTGLGLAISRSVAEAHGGTLKLATTLTPGAAFVITLPAAGARSLGRAPAKPESNS